MESDSTQKNFENWSNWPLADPQSVRRRPRSQRPSKRRHGIGPRDSLNIELREKSSKNDIKGSHIVDISRYFAPFQ